MPEKLRANEKFSDVMKIPWEISRTFASTYLSLDIDSKNVVTLISHFREFLQE